MRTSVHTRGLYFVPATSETVQFSGHICNIWWCRLPATLTTHTNVNWKKMSSEAEEHSQPCSDEIATRSLHALFLALSLLSLVALPGLVGANVLGSRYFRPASLGEPLLSGEHEKPHRLQHVVGTSISNSTRGPERTTIESPRLQSRFELAPAADLKLDCAMKRKNAALQDSGFEQVVKCRAVTSPRRTLFDKSHTLGHGKTDCLHVRETDTKKTGALHTSRKQDHVRV